MALAFSESPYFLTVEGISQVASWVIKDSVPELLEPCARSHVIYYSQTRHVTVDIVPLGNTYRAIQPRHDQVARPRKPYEKIMARTLTLSIQWLIFDENLRTASPDDQHRFFKFCAAIVPEHSKRSEKEWRDHFGRLTLEARNSLSPLLLHQSFSALHERSAGSHPRVDPRFLQTSAKENLAEIRKLLGVTGHIRFGRLALDDRIVQAVPIGFVKDVYESLPITLVNNLPFKTVLRALSVINKTELCIRKPENKFRVLLWQCAVSQEDSSAFRNWMASREGRIHYLQAKNSLRFSLTVEELELSLTTLRCYELVLVDDSWWRDRDNDNSKPVEEPWIAAFTAHMDEFAEIPPRNLWQVVVSSFERAHNNTHPSTALRWLGTVLDDDFSSDGLLQMFWKLRLLEISSASLGEAAYDVLGGQAMHRQVSQRGY